MLSTETKDAPGDKDFSCPAWMEEKDIEIVKGFLALCQQGRPRCDKYFEVRDLLVQDGFLG